MRGRLILGRSGILHLLGVLGKWFGWACGEAGFGGVQGIFGVRVVLVFRKRRALRFRIIVNIRNARLFVNLWSGRPFGEAGPFRMLGMSLIFEMWHLRATKVGWPRGEA